MSPIQTWLARPGGLAEQLTALRSRAFPQAKDFAAALGWQSSKVSRIEVGRSMPTEGDIREWCAAAGADEAEISALLDLRGEAVTERTDWTRRMRGGQQAVQEDYNRLTAAATVVRNFETAWIPGFVQTVPYARAVFTEMRELRLTEVDDVDKAVAARMERQQALYDPAKRFELLMTEWVLRAQRVPPAVLHGQLDRLLAVVGADNVRLGVIPMGVELSITPQASFHLYDDLAVAEDFTGERYYQGPLAARLADMMGRLWADAVEGDEARALILAARQALPA